MQCNNCGAEVDSGLLFCPSCGALVKLGGNRPAESVSQPDMPQAEEREDLRPQPMYKNRIADSQAKPDVAQPAAFQQTQEPAPQPQPAIVPVDEGKSSSGKSTFEILQTTGADNGKSGNKARPTISPKILIGVIAALAVIVIILVAVLLNSGNQDNRNTTEAVTNQPEVNQTQIEEQKKSESDNTPVVQNEDNRQVSASEYDLSNPEDFKLINTFLSNFSEVYGHTASLDTSTMSAEDYARFGVYHCGINSHDDWQFAGGSGSYSDVQGTGGGAQGIYNVRVDGARVAEMVNRYFGVSIDYGSISGGYRGPYHYQDGYVYFGVTAPVSPAGVAVAKSIEHLGNSEYEIKFDVYTPSGGYYDASDGSLYSAPATEVAGKMGVSSPTASGTAIVRKAGSNEYTGGLVLESYRSELL